MPRIALLTRYDSKGASSRVRTLQYLPTLHAAGIETEHFPLFGNDYLESLYHGENTTGLRIRALLNHYLEHSEAPDIAQHPPRIQRFIERCVRLVSPLL